MKLASYLRVIGQGFLVWTLGLALPCSGVAAVLTNGTVHPKNGNLATVFKFNATLQDPVSTNLPQAVHLILDDSVTNVMSAADPADLDPRDGKVYAWSGTLPMARHQFRFATVPAATGDLGRHFGPDVSNAPLLVRQFYFFLNCPADYFAVDSQVRDESRFISAGDLNGDGYADLVHTWYAAGIQGNANEGAVMVYYGPDFVRHDCLLHPRYPAHEQFGYTVAGGGDLDGDGCDDLVIANSSGSRLFVYHGRKSGSPQLVNEISTPALEDLAALVDVNRDGYADLVTVWSFEVHPGCLSDRLRVRPGPVPSTFLESDLGVGVDSTFRGALSITDRNGDGYPDFVFHGQFGTGFYYDFSWRASNCTAQVRSVDGPGLNTSFVQSFDYPRTLLGIGDVDGDAKGDFACGSRDYSQVDWYSGPNLAWRGAVTWSSTNIWFGHFGAGDGTGSGRSSLAILHYSSADQSQRGVRYCWGPAAAPFSSQVFLPAPLVGDLSFDDQYWGPAHDTDGNGLDDFFVAAVGSPVAPLDDLAGQTLGTVLVGSPCYPYPLSESDLPARLRTRMAGCSLELAGFTTIPLSPNGSLELIAGTADADHRAPLILLASALQIPDKPLGKTGNGDLRVVRVRATGEDGSGYIYTDGPLKGQGQLQLWLTVEFIELGVTETVTAHETSLLKVELNPPLDFATGYGKLVCHAPMQQLLADVLAPFGISSINATLTLAGYVEYVRPAEVPFLMRVPARAEFGGVCVGSNTTLQRITLCNLGEAPLRITGLTLPGAPFRITGAPTLPATVNPISALVLMAEYLPTTRGHHEAAITVTSDDPAHPTATVLLSGSAIAPGEHDTDGDGLPDSFEVRYTTPTDAKCSGLSTTLLDAHLDNDRDGAPNQNEYYAGTDPTDAKSVFRLLSAQRISATSLQLNWLSATGRTYGVCRSSNLASGFTPIQSGLVGNGATNAFTDVTVPTGSGAFFYRIRVD